MRPWTTWDWFAGDLGRIHGAQAEDRFRLAWYFPSCWCHHVRNRKHQECSGKKKDGTYGCSMGAEKEEFLRKMWNAVLLESLDPDIENKADCSSSCGVGEDRKIHTDSHHECHLAIDSLPSLESYLRRS
jgi:hypothetical protein